MINLRYHIVSITAVFLALGIGVTLGSSLIQRYTIDTLEGRLDELGERLDRTDGENRALRDELDERDALASRIADEGRSLFAGHLDEVPVLVLSVQGADDDLVVDTRASLRAADALVAGTLTFTARWADLTDDELDELSALLGRRLTNEQVARNIAVRQVVDELLAASAAPPEPAPEPEQVPPEPDEPGLEPDGSALGELPEAEPDSTDDAAGVAGDVPTQVDPDGTGEPDTDGEGVPTETTEPADEPPPVPDAAIIGELIGLGYLEFFPESAGTPLPQFAMRYVLVADDDAVLASRAVLLPLLDAMTLTRSGPAPLIVASALVEVPVPDEANGTVELELAELVAVIRVNDRLSQQVSTVDNLDTFTGQASVVLALARLAEGIVGHHGLGEGAESLVPLGAA
jgi:hypothetical protein